MSDPLCIYFIFWSPGNTVVIWLPQIQCMLLNLVVVYLQSTANMRIIATFMIVLLPCNYQLSKSKVYEILFGGIAVM